MKQLGHRKRQSLYGFLFILPWIIGIACFFVTPFVQTIFYSFNTLTIDRELGFVTAFDGLRHYRTLLQSDPTFMESLGTSLMELAYSVPLTVFYSVFVAVILNRKFVGRTFFRAVFFLPVIVTSGVVMSLLQTDANSAAMLGDSMAESNSAMLQITILNDVFSGLGLGTGISTFISNVVSKVINVGWTSGVQILLILAGLQSVPSHLYEVARVEGATKWEEFWKITFPLTMPIIFISIVYSIIDSFTSYNNTVITVITKSAFDNLNYSYAGAMALVYSLIILLMLGLVYLVIGRRVTYTER